MDLRPMLSLLTQTLPLQAAQMYRFSIVWKPFAKTLFDRGYYVSSYTISNPQLSYDLLFGVQAPMQITHVMPTQSVQLLDTVANTIVQKSSVNVGFAGEDLTLLLVIPVAGDVSGRGSNYAAEQKQAIWNARINGKQIFPVGLRTQAQAIAEAESAFGNLNIPSGSSTELSSKLTNLISIDAATPVGSWGYVVIPSYQKVGGDGVMLDVQRTGAVAYPFQTGTLSLYTYGFVARTYSVSA
jgi:hypothetical protein